MSHADFVHLRVRTTYSLLEGAIRLDELVRDLPRFERMPACAIADRGNMFGALAFSEACSEAGVQPIVGCDLAIGRRTEQPGQQDRAVSWLLLLAQDETGYRNLMALTSNAYLEGGAGGKPQVTPDELAARSEGLLALTGGPAGPGRASPPRRPGQGRPCAAGATRRVLSGPALRGAHAPRFGRGRADRGAADRVCGRARPAVGRDQRRLLPRRRNLRGPRRAALHRPEQPRGGREPAPAHPAAPLPPGPTRCARCSQICRMPWTTR